MCIGCGNTCSDAPPRGPRFTRHAGSVRPVVVGSAAGPDMIPDVLIRTTGQMITFESVWAGLGPNGEPAAVVIPGTYGAHATRAGRR